MSSRRKLIKKSYNDIDSSVKKSYHDNNDSDDDKDNEYKDDDYKDDDSDSENKEKMSNKNNEELLNDLFKSKDILHEDEILKRLRDNFKDNDKLINKTYKYFVKRYNVIKKHAEEFRKKLSDKYANLPVYKLLKKARQYADKYQLTDAEYQLFLNIIKRNQFGKFSTYKYIENTPMGIALGYDARPKTIKLKIKDSYEQQMVNKIDKLYRSSMALDKQIKIQSFTYKDSSKVALIGKFDEKKDTIFKYIHPLIAALFIPKITILEERMIMTNISGLVTKLSKGEQILDYPTKALYDDLVTDPNQSTEFSGINIYDDLYNRASLQIVLWKAINYIRMGKYYEFDSADFDNVLSKYPSSIFDAPDLAYTQDAGNMLRRIMNAFSFRPTQVSLTKTPNSIFPFTSEHYIVSEPDNEKTPTFVSMINIRLPPNENKDKTLNQIKLSDNYSSSQWFTSTKYNPTVYTQKIMASNGVLFFYVNRNYSTVRANYLNQRQPNYSNYPNYSNNNTYFVNQLPLMFSESQKINTRPVDTDMKMTIQGSVFELRSVICTETLDLSGTEVSMGTSAIIIDQNLNNYYYYHPQDAGKMNDGSIIDPIELLTNNPQYGVTFNEKIRNYGTIFMYAKESMF